MLLCSHAESFIMNSQKPAAEIIIWKMAESGLGLSGFRKHYSALTEPAKKQRNWRVNALWDTKLSKQVKKRFFTRLQQLRVTISFNHENLFSFYILFASLQCSKRSYSRHRLCSIMLGMKSLIPEDVLRLRDFFTVRITGVRFSQADIRLSDVIKALASIYTLFNAVNGK